MNISYADAIHKRFPCRNRQGNFDSLNSFVYRPPKSLLANEFILMFMGTHNRVSTVNFFKAQGQRKFVIVAQDSFLL